MSLWRHLQENAQTFPERRFIVGPRRRLNYREAFEQTVAAGDYFRALNSGTIFFYAFDSPAVVIGLIAADLVGVTACVLNRRDDELSARRTIDDLGKGHLFTDEPHLVAVRGAVDHVREILLARKDARATVWDEKPEHSSGRIVILTSGTTGRPKAAQYTWSRLVRQVRYANKVNHQTWLLTYPLNHFAGIQMLLHTLVSGHTLVIPPSRRFEDVESAVRKHGVDSISATPTFWRMLTGRLMARQKEPFQLKQITLGGEASTPELLSGLRRLFPQAALTQVYATTELGTCFSVTDEQAGFPATFLERPVGNVRLKIFDDELYVQSTNKMLGYAGQKSFAAEEEWVATGDIVEVEGARVFFRGRKGEIINVGGVKVHPGKVESAILQVEGIQAVRVFGKPNPITGQLVAAELEPATGLAHEELIYNVREICRRDLNRYEQPQEIIISERLARRNNKIARGTS